MNLISAPYRWDRAPLRNVSSIYWSIRNGIRNVFHLFRASWHCHPWDHSGMLYMMETIMKDMARVQGYGRHTCSDRSAKQLRCCAELCRRIREDDYLENAGGYQGDRDRKRSVYDHAEAMAKQDCQYLGRIFGKYVRTWWD